MAVASELSRAARARGLPPETVLIEMKTAWNVRHPIHLHTRRDTWYEQLVLHFLEEYFKPVPE